MSDIIKKEENEKISNIKNENTEGSSSLLSESALRSLIVQKLLDILSLDTSDNVLFKMILLPLNKIQLSIDILPEDIVPYSIVLRYLYMSISIVIYIYV